MNGMVMLTLSKYAIMKANLFAICFVLFVSVMSCERNEPTEIQVISADEMQTLIDIEDVQVVDVRTPEEYEKGFIENAQNIDFNSPTFDADIDKLDKSKPVVLYCQGGGRSAKCAAKLKGAGFVKIYDLEGGISQWEFKGKEVKTYF